MLACCRCSNCYVDSGKCPPVCPRGGVSGAVPLCPPSCFRYSSTFDVFYKIVRQVYSMCYTNFLIEPASGNVLMAIWLKWNLGRRLKTLEGHNCWTCTCSANGTFTWYAIQEQCQYSVIFVINDNVTLFVRRLGSICHATMSSVIILKHMQQAINLS